MERIALVDENDIIVGYEEKMRVHEEGLLHRAFSIVLYNSCGEMLIQQRAHTKYHSPSLWTNACCSHQRESDASLIAAAERRLYEELGIENVLLKPLDKITYKASFDNGLTEYEVDTVFTGVYDGVLPFNPEEIDAVLWIAPKALKKWRTEKPEVFTVWFKILLDDVL
ncbi:isopentenyl-diphosphate Delta-isomerase [Fusibacter sp. JL298sf-3]